MSKSFEVIFREFADSETFVLSRGLLEDYKRQAAREERERILILLNDPEWHEESKSYQRLDTDLAHQSDYCWGCQLMELIRGENK